MDNIITAISLLDMVLSTMDQIPVAGAANMDKFVGCHNVIQTVSQTLGKFLEESQKEQEHIKKLQKEDEQFEKEGGDMVNGR